MNSCWFFQEGLCSMEFVICLINFIPVSLTPVRPIIPVLTFQGKLNITSYVYESQFCLTVKRFHDYKPSKSNIN
jgi:hypothetical protein